MWFPPRPTTPDWKAALAHLRRSPVLGPIIGRVGPCTLHPRRDYFIVLCQSIFTQQISTTVATILFNRFRDYFPRRRPTPALTLKLDDAALQSTGLSRQKRLYVRDLAAKFADGSIPVRRLRAMPDEEVIQALLPVKGVGRWTAEMFLIFTLNRPDVLPIDDLGLRKGIQTAFALPEMPKPKECVELAEPWRPYRTVATWYLWRGGVPTAMERAN